MTKDEALKLALTNITKVPTLTHGLLVKLADVETAIKEALLYGKSFAEVHPRNLSATCDCEHWQSCVECHPTAHPQERYTTDAMQVRQAVAKALSQPEQEPVAWMHTQLSGAITHRPADLDRHPDRWTALYSGPKPCPTCEALARTVMLDQTSHDTSPPQRQPLTDEEIDQFVVSEIGLDADADLMSEFARAIEAAHGIGDKT